MKTIESSEKFTKKIIVDVDDEISVLVRRVELNYGLTWEEAKNSVTIAIKNLKSKDFLNKN